MACLHGELLWNAIRKPLDKHRPHYSSGRPHSIRPQKDIPHSRSLQRSLLPNARTDAMHKGHVPGRGRFPDLPTQVPLPLLHCQPAAASVAPHMLSMLHAALM